MHGCWQEASEHRSTLRMLRRYAAEARQYDGTKSPLLSDSEDSESHSGVAASQRRLRLQAHISDEPPDRIAARAGGAESPAALVSQIQQILAGSGLSRALVQLRQTIGSVLVIPTFRIIVLQARYDVVALAESTVGEGPTNISYDGPALRMLSGT